MLWTGKAAKAATVDSRAIPNNTVCTVAERMSQRAEEQEERPTAGGSAGEGEKSDRRVQSQRAHGEPPRVSLDKAVVIRAGPQKIGQMLAVIADPGETGIEDVQQRSHRREQKHQRESHLDDVNYVVEGIGGGIVVAPRNECYS
jgi:hypothetical protein